MANYALSLDTREAAAFANLDVLVQIVPSLHTDTNRTVVRFMLEPYSGTGGYNTRALRRRLKTRELEQSEPAHPLLTTLRAFRVHGCLLDLAKKGAFFDHVRVPGTGVWDLVPGQQGLPGIFPGYPLAETSDSHVAAALIVAGFPLLKVTPGSGDKFLFTLAGFNLHTGFEAAKLVLAWRNAPDSLKWEQPFTQAIRGLRCKATLTKMVKESIATVLISKPGTRKHAAIRADATPKAWDKVARHLGGRG